MISNPFAQTPAEGGRIISSRFGWRLLLTRLFLFAVAAMLLWRVRAILPPFLIAFFIAALLDPFVCKMQRKGVSRGRAVATIFLSFFLFIVLVASIIVPITLRQINDLGKNLTTYTSNFSTYTQNITNHADRWYAHHKETMVALGLNESPSTLLNKKTGPIADAVAGALAGMQGVVVSLVGQALWFIIIPLSLFYFLLDYPTIRMRLIWFFPAAHREKVDTISQDIVEIFSAYARTLCILCGCYGLAASLLFTILGLKYPLFLGMNAGVLYAVPYVGPAAAMLSAAVISLTTGKTLAFTGLVVFLFIVMHLSIDYGITPRVLGGSVGLHPLVSIFALMCGATLFGVWGMLIAAPTAGTIQMLLIYFIPRLGEKPPATFSSQQNGA